MVTFLLFVIALPILIPLAWFAFLALIWILPVIFVIAGLFLCIAGHNIGGLWVLMLGVTFIGLGVGFGKEMYTDN